MLHVQCHLGFDSISLARRGARVTGVDFSATALAKGVGLARRAGVDVEWVESDATDLPAALSERFDLAYATVGVICWIGDLAAWMRSVHGTLRPGGRLVLLDSHPLSTMIESIEPLALDFPYANERPYVYATADSYAQGAGPVPAGEAVNYAHSLAAVANPAGAAGFRIVGLDELMESSFEHPPGRVRLEPDGKWRTRVDGELWPVLFALRATRPA